MRITPMLGVNIVDCPDNVLAGKLWRMSEKIDAVRRMFYKDAYGHVEAESRSNHPDPWLPHITEFLEAPWFPFDTVYDCELADREAYYKQVPSHELRRISNSKASQQYPDNKEDLMAICFDVYNPHGDLRTAAERDRELYSLFNTSRPTDPIIRVPIFGTVDGSDLETIRKTMDMVTARKGEGLMLLDMASVHIPGRSKHLIKVKRLMEFVGVVIDFEMARPGTKIEGMVAALIVEVPGCTIPVRVGSGLNNQERLTMVTDSPIGKYIDIEGFDYSKNRNGGISINIPIFKQFTTKKEYIKFVQKSAKKS